MHNIVWEISKLSQFYNSGPPISLLEENSPLFDAFPTCARCYYTCPPPDQNSRSKIIYRFQIYESRFPGGRRLFPDLRILGHKSQSQSSRTKEANLKSEKSDGEQKKRVGFWEREWVPQFHLGGWKSSWPQNHRSSSCNRTQWGWWAFVIVLLLLSLLLLLL